MFIRMTIIKKKKSGCKDVEKSENLCMTGGDVNWCSQCGKQFVSKSDTKLLYDPAIPILGIHTEEWKASSHIFVHMYKQCSQHYLQWPKGGSNSNVHQRMNS